MARSSRPSGLFSQPDRVGRHRRDLIEQVRWEPGDGARSYFREKVGWFLCKMGIRGANLVFAWLRAREGRSVDALAPGGDEGRGTLRKAMGSREQALIHGYPNGATHPAMGITI
jgi:hypothetical protein